jgi:hypothetical protein
MVEGQTYAAKCGKEITHSRIVLMWDFVEMGSPLSLSPFCCCRKCWRSLQELTSDPWKHQRYLYGIVSKEFGEKTI